MVFFLTEDYDGLDSTKDYLFGGRSFTLYEATDTGLREVFTSDDDFEALTADYLPDYFNTSNDNAVVDDRSGKKGPEPESVTVGTVDGHTYAFVALERTGGVMVYDVTDPAAVSYVNYINSRDFTSVVPGSEEYDDGELDKWVTGGDVAPEGLAFIPAAESVTGEALLLAACEVSGTVAVYELTEPVINSNHGGNDGGDQKPETQLPFRDVSKDSWYYDAVCYVVEQKLMAGVSENTFAPQQSFSRAMLAQILYNLEGQPAAGGAPFADVAEGSWYAAAVAWCAENHLVSGYDEDTFAPDEAVTREQMALMLYRYAQFKSWDVSGQGDLERFTDSGEISSWAANGLKWAVGAGVMGGKDGGVLDPAGTATRAEVAQILKNFTQLKDAQ